MRQCTLQYELAYFYFTPPSTRFLHSDFKWRKFAGSLQFSLKYIHSLFKCKRKNFQLKNREGIQLNTLHLPRTIQIIIFTLRKTYSKYSSIWLLFNNKINVFFYPIFTTKFTQITIKWINNFIYKLFSVKNS